MKKTPTLIVLAIFLNNAYAADNTASTAKNPDETRTYEAIKVDYRFYDKRVEDALLKDFCKGVGEGEECRVTPSPQKQCLGRLLRRNLQERGGELQGKIPPRPGAHSEPA